MSQKELLHLFIFPTFINLIQNTVDPILAVDCDAQALILFQINNANICNYNGILMETTLDQNVRKYAFF